MELRSHNGKVHLLHSPSSAAVVSFLVMLALLALLMHHLANLAAREKHLEAHYWASAFATKLRGHLEANLAVGYGLEAQISVLGTLDQNNLDRVAARLLQKPLNIATLLWHRI